MKWILDIVCRNASPNMPTEFIKCIFKCTNHHRGGRERLEYCLAYKNGRITGSKFCNRIACSKSILLFNAI